MSAANKTSSPAGQPNNRPNTGDPAGRSDRYGNTRNTAFSGKIVVFILAVILAGVAAYMVAQFLRTNHSDVSAQESGGSIISDSRLQASVDVTRDDASKPAYCILTAMNYDKNEVGRREFLVPAGGEKVQRFLVDVPTTERAHAAKVYGCSTVIPDYLTGSDAQASQR